MSQCDLIVGMGRVQSPRVGAGSSFNLLVINERLKVDHKKYHYITVTVLPFICFAANLSYRAHCGR